MEPSDCDSNARAARADRTGDDPSCGIRAGVALIYLLALLLWGSPWWAGLAALFASLDGMHIVHSRVAMLDGIQSTFLVAAAVFWVLARRRPERRWLVWCGVMLGAAVATK